MESRGDKQMTEEELNAEMEQFIKEEKAKGSSASLGSSVTGSGQRRGPPKRKTASNNLKEEVGG